MYVIVRDDSRTGVAIANNVVAQTLEDAHMLLRHYQLEYPDTRLNPRIMELHTLALKPALVESLRIEEVPSAEAES